MFCSHDMESDPEGYGISWLPCRKCKNPDLKKKALMEFEKEVKLRKDWLTERRRIDKELKVKKPLLHLETAHFTWTFDIPRMKLNKKVRTSHQALHILAERMEIFYQEFHKKFRTSEKDYINNTFRIMAFSRGVIAQRATGKYAQSHNKSGMMLKVDNPAAYVCWWNKAALPNEEDFFCSLIHNSTHFFTAAYQCGFWSHPVGIFYEGMAHWWEIYWYGHSTTYCRTENHTLSGWINDEWKVKLLKLVKAKKAPPLTESLQPNGGSMSFQQHMIGWSIVDYMMSKSPRKTLDFIAQLKKQKLPRDVFQSIWGISMLRFEEQWKEYVLEVYSQKIKSNPFIKSFSKII